MGRLTNLNPPTAIADSDIPGSIARDAELTATMNAHIAAPNPHPAIEQLTTTGLLSTTGSAPPLTSPSSSSRVGWGISDGNPFLFFINQFAPVGAKIFDVIFDKLGKLSVRRLDDNYSPANSTNFLEIDPQGNIALHKNLQVNGFTDFGCGGIKLKKIEAVSGSAQDTYTTYPHGLPDVRKIIFCSAVIYPGSLAMPPNFLVSSVGCTFSVYCHGEYLVMYLPPNTSSNILSKPFVATLLYGE
jgi:hypothetical protein